MKLEPQNRLAEICEVTGLGNFRPTDALLQKWGISASRFNQLRNNEARLNMDVQEARVLREWLRENFAPQHHYLFADEVPPVERTKTSHQQQLQLR